jgi:hypothetical protein
MLAKWEIILIGIITALISAILSLLGLLAPVAE